MIFNGVSVELREGCVRVASGTIVEVGKGPGAGRPGHRLPRPYGRSRADRCALPRVRRQPQPAGDRDQSAELPGPGRGEAAGWRAGPRVHHGPGSGRRRRGPGPGDPGGPDGGAQVPVLRGRAEPDRRPWRSAAAGARAAVSAGVTWRRWSTALTRCAARPASGCAAARTPSRSWPRAGSSRRRIRSGCRSTRRRRSASSPRRRPAAAVTWPPMPTRRRRSQWPWPTGSAPSSTGTCWTRRPPP